MQIALSLLLVYLALLLSAFIAQGAVALVTGKPLDEDRLAFVVGQAVAKLGAAIAFVGIWLMVRYDRIDRVWTYVIFWWLAFVLYAIGRSVGPDHDWTDGISGIVSASIALPLAGLVLARVLRD